MSVRTLELVLVGGIGLCVMIIGICILQKEKRKIAACSSMCKGRVIGYSYSNNVPRCVVEYSVDGKLYQTKKKYRAVKEVSVLLSAKDFKGQNNSIYVDDEDVIHIIKGAIIDYKVFAQKLWPMNSFVDVYYDPSFPECAFVERVVDKPSITAMFFIWGGMLILVLAECIHMIM